MLTFEDVDVSALASVNSWIGNNNDTSSLLSYRKRKYEQNSNSTSRNFKIEL